MKAAILKVIGLKEKAAVTQVFDAQTNAQATHSHYFVK